MKKPSFKDRFSYWFDNRMSKGSMSLIRVLIIFTILIILTLTFFIMITGTNGERSIVEVVWDNMHTIINAWVPEYNPEDSLLYPIILSVAAVAGLLVTSVLIGIVTSAIEEKIMALRNGNSPVLENDHVIVLGFYGGEYTLIRQLVLAAGSQPLTIVIGAEMEREEMEQHIQENVDVPNNVRIICRTVDLFDPMAIERLSVETCRTIIISPTDDSTTIKTLLAVSPLIKGTKIRVNAITSKDENRFPPTIAKTHNVTTLQTNDTLAKIIAHSCTQSGLSEVFKEIFNFEGSELYLVRLPGQAGISFGEMIGRVDHAVPVGICRKGEITMNPPADTVFEESDDLLVFAQEKTSAILKADSFQFQASGELAPVKPERDTRTTIFGQNSTLKTVLREVPENVQQVTLVNYDGNQLESIRKICEERDMKLCFDEGNLHLETDLLRITKGTEHIIILSDHEKDDEEADMDSIFLLLNLRDIRNKYHLRYNITAEMRREKNQSLVTGYDNTDFIVASNMSSLFLAQLAESPQLLTAFAEILSNKGNELYLKTPKNLNCLGNLSVLEIRNRLYRQGYIFLGIMDENNEYLFNPGLDLKLEIRSTHKLIVFGEN
ncbi:MAG: hypothetical protein E7185_02525 [Erysipelotrichaceae bacterium]|nr:hypothetical protein [Erysipelotrichaceae bacterium]